MTEPKIVGSWRKQAGPACAARYPDVLVILPLTFKGVKSMQRLQVLQPKIKEIQERYKDDKQRMNQEIMAFYQREKEEGESAPAFFQRMDIQRVTGELLDLQHLTEADAVPAAARHSR